MQNQRFFGGRTSAHIRKVAVPIVYCDFLSMYPTVNSLMDLWRFVTAREIRVVEHCQTEIQDFVSRVTVADLLQTDTWKYLPAFVRVIPDGDILPTRAKYSVETRDWQVGINHLYSQGDDSYNALWFSLPDIVASKLLYGRAPQIVDAFRIEAHSMLQGLKPTKLRGAVAVDPSTQDFFKVAIEERQHLASRTDVSDTERDRLRRALKVLANAASYGIYAQMDRREADRKIDVICYGRYGKYICSRVTHPEEPGDYCFPPMASLITGAARLMLALLEHCVVTELGGTYAMEDTDSMAIVATEHGGLVPCLGGLFRSPDNREAVKALSWAQVREISDRFAALNPYDRSAVPGSVLKIEDDNFDPATGEQRQLWCLAISAKRYALFLLDENSDPVLLRGSCPFCSRKNKPNATNCLRCHKPIRLNNEEDRWSEHGLGHLLNPNDPDDEDREWIAKVWLNIIRSVQRSPTDDLGFENSPAIGQMPISSPAVMRPLTALNTGKPYWDQIKPFNFLLTSHVRAFGHPPGTDPERFHLIAPYETDPKKWLKSSWIDQYTGDPYRITTAGHYGTPNAARVKTYGEVLREYEFHPESKCANAHGKPCSRQTIGLLQRRHVRVDSITPIGKESNNLEGVEAGVIHSEQEVYTVYTDPRRDEWETKMQPAMKKVPLSVLQKMTGLSRRTLIDARTGRRRPHRKNQELIVAALRKLGADSDLIFGA